MVQWYADCNLWQTVGENKAQSDNTTIHVDFNAVLIRLVDQVKISLLLKIQWPEHDYLSEHRCNSVWEL